MGDGEERDPAPKRILDPDGRVVDGASVPDIDDDMLVRMYEELLLTRRFDERAVSLQRQGRLGTFPPAAGQEATQIGSTHVLRPDDWILFQYREHGSVVVRGLEPEYLLYWMGYEEGNAWLADRNIFPLNIGIGSHIPQGVGMGWASKLTDSDQVVVTYFGDGATSQGDFHEGLNFAGVMNVPCVFFCTNNKWAISMPREQQTASESLAQKATAYGFTGIQVDGMDPLAVYAVTEEAVANARDPSAEMRPTLIEAIAYRFGAHTTADDPTRYRESDEVEEWKRQDPVARMEAFLQRTGRLDEDAAATIKSRVADRVDDVVAQAGERAERDPDRMFESVYASVPETLREQQAGLRRLRETHGDDALLDEE